MVELSHETREQGKPLESEGEAEVSDSLSEAHDRRLEWERKGPPQAAESGENRGSMNPTPLLILSDAPTLPTGLGRITRELATRIFPMKSEETDSTALHLPLFRVGTYGLGETGTRYQPFMHYAMQVNQQMVPQNLPQVWEDFAGGERGILLAIWNPSWLGWLAEPEKLPKSVLKDFLLSNPFEKWVYAPVDGDGEDGKLPGLRDIFLGFDRILAYTKFGQDAIWKTLEGARALVDIDHLPHGLDASVFYPRDRKEARRTFVNRIMQHGEAGLPDDVFMVGVCATNSPRKDWYLAFQACRELLQMGKSVGLWAHTDTFQSNWNMPSLMEQFGMTGRTFFSNRKLTDDEMAWGYSAMDVTWGIGSGEGWGFPLAESLACGVPVIHGDYAAGAEFVPEVFRVKPIGFRGEGFYGIKRPVFDPHGWATITLRAHGLSATLPEYIDWKNAWPRWEKWLEEGVK
jgi:glycosyltransferase involved in cell wall biosynthesis